MDVDDLGHEDQVSLWIGRVARRAVEIERAMLSTYLLLAGGLAWTVYPTNVSTIIRDIGKMLKYSALDGEQIEACKVGLAYIVQVLEKRNNAVHSWWYHEPEDPPKVFTTQPKVSPSFSGQVAEATSWNLDEFKQISREVKRATLVASGILSTVQGLTEPEYRKPYFRTLLIEQMYGRFEFTDESQFRMTNRDALNRLKQELDVDKAAANSSAPFCKPD